MQPAQLKALIIAALVVVPISSAAQSGTKLPQQFLGHWCAVAPSDAETDTDNTDIYTRGKCGDDKEEQNRFEIQPRFARGGEVQCPYTVVSKKLDRWTIKVQCTKADSFHQQLWLVGQRLHIKSLDP